MQLQAPLGDSIREALRTPRGVDLPRADVAAGTGMLVGGGVMLCSCWLFCSQLPPENAAAIAAASAMRSPDD